MSTKRKRLEPFRFRSSEEDNKRQYDELFGGRHTPATPSQVVPFPEEKTVDVPNTVETPTSLPPTVVTTTYLIDPPTYPGTLWLSMKGSVYESRRTFEVKRAQDSMTQSEENVYNTLWRQQNFGPFRVLTEGKRVRVFQAGYDILAEILRLDEKTIRKSVIPTLLEKFILSRVQPSSFVKGQRAQGAVYELFCYADILKRQKEAGYTRAIRNGRAIELAKPREGFQTETPASVSPTVGIPTYVAGSPTCETPADNVGLTPTYNVGVSSLYLLDQDLLDNKNSNDDDVGAVEKLERQILTSPYAHVDRNAIGQIWRQSREAVPDVLPDEVFLLFQEKAAALCRNRHVQNFTGLLLSAWSGYLTPGRVRLCRDDLRRRKREEEDREARERQDGIDTWTMILESPDTPEEHRRMARDELARLAPRPARAGN